MNLDSSIRIDNFNSSSVPLPNFLDESYNRTADTFDVLRNSFTTYQFVASNIPRSLISGKRTSDVHSDVSAQPGKLFDLRSSVHSIPPLHIALIAARSSFYLSAASGLTSLPHRPIRVASQQSSNSGRSGHAHPHAALLQRLHLLSSAPRREQTARHARLSQPHGGIPILYTCGIPTTSIRGIPTHSACGIPTHPICGIPTTPICGIPTHPIRGIPTSGYSVHNHSAHRSPARSVDAVGPVRGVLDQHAAPSALPALSILPAPSILREFPHGAGSGKPGSVQSDGHRAGDGLRVDHRVSRDQHVGRLVRNQFVDDELAAARISGAGERDLDAWTREWRADGSQQRGGRWRRKLGESGARGRKAWTAVSREEGGAEGRSERRGGRECDVGVGRRG